MADDRLDDTEDEADEAASLPADRDRTDYFVWSDGDVEVTIPDEDEGGDQD